MHTIVNTLKHIQILCAHTPHAHTHTHTHTHYTRTHTLHAHTPLYLHTHTLHTHTHTYFAHSTHACKHNDNNTHSILHTCSTAVTTFIHLGGIMQQRDDYIVHCPKSILPPHPPQHIYSEEVILTPGSNSICDINYDCGITIVTSC